jgi:hypothetical protein
MCGILVEDLAQPGRWARSPWAARPWSAASTGAPDRGPGPAWPWPARPGRGSRPGHRPWSASAAPGTPWLVQLGREYRGAPVEDLAQPGPGQRGPVEVRGQVTGPGRPARRRVSTGQSRAAWPGSAASTGAPDRGPGPARPLGIVAGRPRARAPARRARRRASARPAGRPARRALRHPGRGPGPAWPRPARPARPGRGSRPGHRPAPGGPGRPARRWAP